MFYDVFLSLCDVSGVSPAAVRKDLGISQSTMASWKSRGLTPNANTIVKLSNYFHVSVDYLLGTEDMVEKPYDTYDTYDTLKSAKRILPESSDFRKSQLLSAFIKLNASGQQKVADYAEDLSKIPEYQATQSHSVPQSPASNTDTPEQQNAAEDGSEPEKDK